MQKIDYKAYLATLGDFETNQKNRIKNYLEEQCKTDECLKALYRPEKIDDCYNFIIECAKEKMTRDGHVGVSMLEDAIGYKMARDFFIEVLPKVAEDAPETKATTEENTDVVKVEAVETPAEVVQDMDADAADDDVLRDEYGFEVFGEEAEKPAETEEAPCHQDEVEEKEPEEEIRYDPQGNALLFDFM